MFGGRRRGADAKGPHSWAAFGEDDVDDARRGAPDRDLRDYARERGLVYDDRALSGAHMGVMPRWEAYAFNATRGILGGRVGVVLHELLELDVTTSEHTGISLTMGGDFADKKLRGDRITPLSFVPVIGMFSSSRDEPFPELTAAAPVTTVALHVPEAALLEPFTVRSADRLRSDDGVRLTAHDLPGYRLRGADTLAPELQRRLFGGPAGAVLRELGDEAYVSLDHKQGAVALRRNGFITDPQALDRLVAQTGTIADALAEVALVPSGAPARFADPLPAAPAEDEATDVDRWSRTLDGAVAHFGLVREDPAALHRAYPTLPVPGRARGVLRGTLPGIGVDGRLSYHQHRYGSYALQAAALFPLAADARPTAPGGLFHEPSDMLVATCGDLVACWKRTLDQQELSVTGTAERGWAAATALGLAAR